MKCFFCQGSLNQSTTEYVEKQGNFIIVIENIPCERCDQCGETYFSDETAQQLEKILNSIQSFSSSLTVTVIDYNQKAA